LIINFFGDRGIPSADGLRAFAARHRVDRFVVVPGAPFPTADEMKTFGPVQRVGGVDVAPACNSPSLTSRPLPASARRMLGLQQQGVAIRWCHDGYPYNLPAGLQPAALLAGGTKGVVVEGGKLECEAPDGYVDKGFAPPRRGIPPLTYRLYGRR
jgi:hypothetical protein